MKNNFINLNIKNFVINKNSTLFEALKTIQNGEEGFCIVVDKGNILVNLITDGDIRRSLVSGLNLKDKIYKVKSKLPIVVKDKNKYEESVKRINSRINIIPYVDHKGALIGILKKKNLLKDINIRSKKITIVGLGYVGLTLALTLADNGFEVLGYDNDKKVINSLKNYQPLFYEKGISSLLEKHLGHNLKITNEVNKISSDIYIISVGTPINKSNKKPNISHLIKSVKQIANKIKIDDLVIFRSTVPVGTTRNQAIPIIEKLSKLKAGKDFYVSFCPERTVEGKALLELKRLPQIIGGFCGNSTELCMRLFNEYTHTVIDVENIESAEFCKLIDNSYRDLIFSYSNQLSLFAEKINLDLPKLIDKVNLGYSRNLIPKPSPGVGGACLTKDPYLLDYSFKKTNLKASINIEGRKINEKICNNIYLRFNKFIKEAKLNKKNFKIFISGFAFKGEPETSDLRDSTTIDFLNILKKNKFYNIYGHDYLVSKSEIRALGIKYENIKNGFKNANCVFIMNNNNKYSDIEILKLASTMKKPALIFDSWQMINNINVKEITGVTYMGVGFNQ